MKIYKTKYDLTGRINGLIIDNMRDWKSTKTITIKEWNKLDKEIDYCVGEYLKHRAKPCQEALNELLREKC